MSRDDVVRAGLLVALVLLAYFPAMSGGFVWDDDSMLTANIILEKDGLYRTWFTTEQLNYWPMVWTSFWIEHQLWELNPTGYHVTNILLHAACTLLAWRVLLRLQIPAAWMIALVFAVHPVNVESVAWITQRKNLLSMFFYLLALLSYLRFDDEQQRRWYWSALGMFVLALLSKGAVITLPAVVLLCVWWHRNAITGRDVLRTLPLWGIAVVMSAVEIWFQYVRVIGTEVIRDDGLLGRLAGAGWVVWFYAYKAVLPIDLSFIYPRWQIDGTDWLAHMPNLALMGLGFACWRFRNTWGRAVFFALAYFVGTLSPVLGFFDFYFMKYSFVGDHYQYVSIIGIIALVIGGGWTLWQRQFAPSRNATCAAGVALLCCLTMLTWRQASLYRDSETLWRDTIAKNESCTMAHNNLGKLLYEQHRLESAILQYRQAIQFDPKYVEARNNLVVALHDNRQFDAAIEAGFRALEAGAENSLLHSTLGVYLSEAERYEESARHFQTALRLDPNNEFILFNQGNMQVASGQFELALKSFAAAIAVDTNFAAAYVNRGNAYLELGQRQQAIAAFRRALEIQPGLAAARQGLEEARSGQR